MDSKDAMKALQERVHTLEKELLETRSVLQAALDQSLAGIVIATAPDHKVRYFNDAFLGIAGMTRQDMGQGLDLEAYAGIFQVHDRNGAPIPAQDRPLVRALTRGETASREILLQGPTPPGRILWVNAGPVHDASGAVTAGVAIFMDVTERVRAEEILSQVVGNMANGVAIYEAMGDGNDFFFKDINPAGARIGNIPREAHIGQSVMKVYPGVRQMGLLEVLGRVWKTGEAEWHPLTAYEDNRIQIWVENYVFRLPGGEVAAVYEDVTERKRREMDLEASRQTLLTVLESIDASIHVVDLETCEVLFVNEKGRLRFQNPDFQGKCWEVLRRRTSPCPGCPALGLLDENGRPLGVQVREERNEATGQWFLNHDRAITWTDGRLVKLQVAMDMTEFKDMENKLRQARKMEAIGTLAGGIAHDFNNILTAILGNAELAMDFAPPGTPLRENLTEIFKAGERSRELVRQILTFARVSNAQSGTIPIKIVVKDALKLLRPSLPSTTDIRTRFETSANVLADESDIHQLVLNLCINASHAMEGKIGMLEIRLVEEQVDAMTTVQGWEVAPGAYVRLAVSDTGCGMTPEIMEKIFDPYFTTKEVGEGTGMGLSVVQGIVRNCKGWISVESHVGHGSTFSVYLPIAAPQRATRIKPQELEEPKRGNESILFVDDEPAIVRLFEQTLKKMGYRAACKTSSQEALDLFRQAPDDFDLVITDMTMPNMTGLDFASKIKEIRPDIPVILCSGNNRNLSPERTAKHGVDTVVAKPVIHNELAHAIAAMLKRFPTRGTQKSTQDDRQNQ